MLIRQYRISYLLFFFLVYTLGAKDVPNTVIKQKVSAYFQEQFNVSQSDIQLRFIHLPDLSQLDSEGSRWVVESDHAIPRLGYQTLWVKFMKGEFLENRMPVMVDALIYKDVLVAARKINRGEIIKPEMITSERMGIDRNYNSLIRDSDLALGLITKHLIKPGTPLKATMLQIPPVVKKGDIVKVQLMAGDLIVLTQGLAKQNGFIGDKVRVSCEPSGKQIFGVVQSPQLVVVNLE